MADRYAAFVVSLDQDLPEDEARRVRDALRMIRGVIGVEPVVSSVEVAVAQSRADAVWRERIANLATAGGSTGD